MTARASEIAREEQMDAAEVPAETPGLSDRELAFLAFERQWWKAAGAKDKAIRETFDMSSTRYYQLLNALLETPEAMAADPMLVKRLRRLRATRRARRLGLEPR